jgi:hypothetical protein
MNRDAPAAPENGLDDLSEEARLHALAILRGRRGVSRSLTAEERAAIGAAAEADGSEDVGDADQAHRRPRPHRPR